MATAEKMAANAVMGGSSDIALGEFLRNLTILGTSQLEEA
jgi:hypothetical protein